jgi:uncharacterized membrane-anchored protein YhcB (DUF1043 family)
MELWLIAIGALAIGSVIGVAVSGRLGNTNPARINELETQLEAAEQKHDAYRDSVSDHFNTTAELVHQMTESYRDVYQHLAHGAQELCTKEVAGKMLPAGEDRLFLNKQPAESFSEPPKDYAANKEPGKAGALSEEFGLEKPLQDDDADSTKKD